MADTDELPDDIWAKAEKLVRAPIADDVGNSLAYFAGRYAANAVGVVAAAILGERERCAQIAENNNAWPQEGADIAAAIRQSQP